MTFTSSIRFGARAIAITAALCLGASAHAALGDYLVVKSDGEVVLTFEGSDAGYDSTISVNGSPQIFPNHATAVGTTYDLGFFSAGTVLDASLFVVQTGTTFHSGPGSLNPDGYAHALVTDNWNGTGRTYVGFEDIFGTVDGTGDYNDHTFSFSNTSVAPSVPEPAGLGLAAAGLVAVAAAIRRRAKPNA
jgi:hypothetical protein